MHINDGVIFKKDDADDRQQSGVEKSDKTSGF